MADSGDNGDSVEPEEVEVKEVQEPAEKPPERILLEELVIGLLKRAINIVGVNDDAAKTPLTQELRLELKEVCVVLGRVGNFLFPKLAALHQINEDSEGFFARMQATFTPDDAKKALAMKQRRLHRARTQSGRPKQEIVDPHDR